MALEKISRRELMRRVGWTAGGLTLGAWAGNLPWTPAALAQDVPADASQAFDPSVYLSIAEDGTVTVICHRSEMGQGSKTGLAAVLVDELEADWDRVEIRQAIGDEKYGSQNTDGSTSIRNFYQPFREAGAVARQMLITAAAAQWGVSPQSCRAEAHQVVHRASGRRLGYGDLARAAAALEIPEVETITLKPAFEQRLVGQPLPIVDLDDMVTGRASFGLDVRLPGMKVALIARPPVVGGRVATLDSSAAEAMAGVQVYTLPVPEGAPGFQPLGGVAVVAPDTWTAMRARRALVITWDDGPHGGYDTEAYRQTLEVTARQPGEPVRVVGNVDHALEGADQRHEADYYAPHLAQAPMEPPCATAHVHDGICEAWAPTQNPQAAQSQVAATLGFEVAQVTIHVTLLGGGFGRKSKPDFIAEAAWLSQEVGAPVQVVWTRGDDLRHGYLHANSAQHLEAGLSADGKVVAWRHRTVFPSISTTFSADAKAPSNGEMGLGLADLPFDIPNLAIERGEARAHVRIGWLRSVCNIYHAFAIGSFIDELADRAGRDPLSLWQELIGPAREVDFGEVEISNYGQPLTVHPVDTGRLRRVLDATAEDAGWGRDMATGSGLGISVHRSFLSYVAVAAAVTVTAGKLRVDDVWITIDCGTYVNPDRVRAQMEGSVIYGLSLAFYGAIEAKDGAIVQQNFGDYRVLRLHETPRIHVRLMPSQGLPAGVGEPGVPPVTPAVTNALFAATGERVRELPLSKAGWV